MKGAEMIVQALADEGVDTVFGKPGGAKLTTYDALYGYGDHLRHKWANVTFAPDFRVVAEAEDGIQAVELAADGSCVITKHDGTGGAVTVDTVTPITNGRSRPLLSAASMISAFCLSNSFMAAFVKIVSPCSESARSATFCVIVSPLTRCRACERLPGLRVVSSSREIAVTGTGQPTG